MSIKEIELAFRMERRTFLKWSAAAGVAGMVMNLEEAHAAGECGQILSEKVPEKVLATLSKSGVTGAEGLSGDQKIKAAALNTSFFYWFDGPMVAGMEVGGKFRGRLAIFLDRRIPAGEFLETVMLADGSRNILEERRFESAQATLTGKAPYVVFDNIELAKADHHVYFVISKTDGSSVSVYRYSILAADVRMSRFDYSHLAADTRNKIPPIFIDEMKEAGHALQASPNEFGMITTPFQHFAEMPTHIVRAQFQYMDTSGNFSICIEPMHDDENDGHYMRYFCVTDPVGRFLGVKRRKYDAAKGSHSDADLVSNTRKFYFVNATYKPGGESNADAAWASHISTTDSNICDCPYVQVITEDRRDAIARISIRLR